MSSMEPRWPAKTRGMHNHHFDSTVWNGFPFRDDHIIIGTCAKSGTTWTQQIFAQLLFMGADDLTVAEPTQSLSTPKSCDGSRPPRPFSCRPFLTMRTNLLALMTALLLCSVAFAAPPKNVSPDPELHKWFESLRQPGTNLLCCSEADCRLVVFEVHDGYYEAEIDGWKYVVPKGAIISGISNPTGKAVACYAYSAFLPPAPPGQPTDGPQDVIEILCFVPPRPAV